MQGNTCSIFDSVKFNQTQSQSIRLNRKIPVYQGTSLADGGRASPLTLSPENPAESECRTMKTTQLNKQEATAIVTESTAKVKDFDQVKRDFEAAYISGECGKELLELAQAVAYSVVKKCVDPQRKTAAERDTVSQSGMNPALVALRQGITHDIQLLESTARAAEKATRATLTPDGDPVTEVIDQEAETLLGNLIGETLTDGIDLVNEAALALLEQAEAHATAAPGWLDSPYTIRRLAKRVYIRAEDSAAYREEDTTPIQEAFRAVRRAVQQSRAIQTDPRNGYSYIEELAEGGLDTIYYRLKKYADLGGYNTSGNYTTDKQTAEDYNTIIARLDLTPRQREIVEYRMRGASVVEIGNVLNISEKAVRNTLHRLQDKCAALGIIPKDWTAESRENAVEKSVAVVQMDRDGNILGRYASAGEASAATGIDDGSIRAAARGKRKTAGGYVWTLDK